MGQQTWALSDLHDEPLQTLPLNQLSDSAEPQSSKGALVMAGAAKAAPAAVKVAEEIATNPSLVSTAKTIGKVTGGLAGLKTGPVGAGLGAIGGEKSGAIVGHLAQSTAAPVARVLEAVAPYAQALSTLSGAQGVNDLAQMAEPNRKDIGFLGVGSGTPDPAHPALLNLLAMKVTDAVKALVAQGLSLGEATRQVINAKVKASQ